MKKVEIFLSFGDFGLYVLYEHTILQGDAMSLNASKLQSETIVGPSKFFFFQNQAHSIPGVTVQTV